MSNYITLGNIFELYQVINGTERNMGRYTNACTPGSTLSYRNSTYTYLSFIYQGAAKNRTGDNLQAGLILSTNEISTGLSREAVINRYHLRVWTVVMNPTNKSQVQKLLTEEDWVVASMVYDVEAVEVVLSSSIDAVGANAPTRVLTRDLVGALPVTASIQAQ